MPGRVRKTLERVTENAVLRWTRGHGITDTKMNTMGRNAWPDRCFWIPLGKPLFIEFKRLGEKPTPAQADIHQLLRTLGYEVGVYDNPEEALELIRKRIARLRK